MDGDCINPNKIFGKDKLQLALRSSQSLQPKMYAYNFLGF